MGKSNREIADELNNSVVTVMARVSHIRSKMGARNLTEAMLFAREYLGT